MVTNPLSNAPELRLGGISPREQSMPDDELEQIADQNDFHVNNREDARGAKRGSLQSNIRKRILTKLLRHKSKKNNVTLPNQQNQP